MIQLHKQVVCAIMSDMSTAANTIPSVTTNGTNNLPIPSYHTITPSTTSNPLPYSSTTGNLDIGMGWADNSGGPYYSPIIILPSTSPTPIPAQTSGPLPYYTTYKYSDSIIKVYWKVISGVHISIKPVSTQFNALGKLDDAHDLLEGLRAINSFLLNDIKIGNTFIDLIINDEYPYNGDLKDRSVISRFRYKLEWETIPAQLQDLAFEFIGTYNRFMGKI